ncbi:MAG TPA: enoyl-CoA hydratase/isomerase family protein [Acidimicrobiales bacterium]|nr:enoyl-CoA hydratase/isomerase family protein [Acidimicrobiales bacterium]
MITVTRDASLEGLVTITLDRPEKLNALSVELHDALQPVLVELETDPTARVVVLTGAGRAFSAGADLSSRRSSKPVNDIDRLQRAHLGGRTTELLDRLPQVVIASINGLAVGGAVVFLTACDIRLAAASAWFSIPEVELGMPLTWQAIPRLMRELGPARTKELVMACERFSAQDAERWGFVNRVYPDGELAGETRALAERLLSMDTLALSLTKAACAAAANTMVTVDTNWADPELMLHTYRRMRDR